MKALVSVFLILSSTFGTVDETNRLGESPSHMPRQFRVCIDPGHPSETSDGAELDNGLREVSVNWEIAQLLTQKLQNNGFVCVVTKKRESDFVTNKGRATIANAMNADLFLRLHADAGNSTGFTVYFPRRKGTVKGVSGPTAQVLSASSAVARRFHFALASALRGKLRDNGLRGDDETFVGSRQGALTGSIFSKVPTVLVEMLFLTNPDDAAWIKENSNKAAMVDALAAGVTAVRDMEQVSR